MASQVLNSQKLKDTQVKAAQRVMGARTLRWQIFSTTLPPVTNEHSVLVTL